MVGFAQPSGSSSAPKLGLTDDETGWEAKNVRYMPYFLSGAEFTAKPRDRPGNALLHPGFLVHAGQWQPGRGCGQLVS